MSDWFTQLFGFSEEAAKGTDAAYERVQNNFGAYLVHGTQDEWVLTSKVNGAEFPVGSFNCPTLAELRHAGMQVLQRRSDPRAHVDVVHRAIQGALELHATHPGAVFQMASQLNCLEFPGQDLTPEHGVTMYAQDRTQGPDCALACAAGAVWRTYMVPREGSDRFGQQRDTQINTLSDLEEMMDNDTLRYWTVSNGYITAARGAPGLKAMRDAMALVDHSKLRDVIRVGVQENVGVTFSGRWSVPAQDIRVTQVMCSALSLGMYANVEDANAAWEPMARLILEAAYEATLWQAVIASGKTGVHDVFLTFLGGGVFENDPQWIYRAIGRAVATLRKAGARLTVHICHFREIKRTIEPLIQAAIDDRAQALSKQQ